jgi:coatomer subunit beta
VLLVIPAVAHFLCQSRYSRCIFELLNASSYAVKYEAATTLTVLTQNTAAVKGEYLYISFENLQADGVFAAAASCFINLVIKESDNNVKLIVLDRLETLQSKHRHMLDGLIVDVLQILSR